MAHQPAVRQQHSQLAGLAGCGRRSGGARFDPLLGLLFGLASGSLRQRMKLGVIHTATPFGRHPGCTLIRAGLNDGEAEPLLQGRCHLLMRPDGPGLPLRAKPAPTAGLLPVIRFNLNPPDAAFQRQLFFFDIAPGAWPRGGEKDWLIPSARPCNFCSNRRRVHSRPSFKTSSSISAKVGSRSGLSCISLIWA